MRNGLTTSGESLLQRRVIEKVEGDLFIVDVGANVGSWTIQFCDQFRAIRGLNEHLPRILLIEPAPSSVAALRERFANYARAEVLDVAVGPESGSTRIVHEEESPLNHILLESEAPGECNWIQVQVRTLDDVLQAHLTDGGLIDLIKIDAEGYDFQVLLGLANLLALEKVRVIQFEYNHRWLRFGNSLYNVFQLAKDSSLNVLKITPKGLQLLTEWHPELDKFWDGNYALVNPRLISIGPVHSTRFSNRNVLFVD